MSVTTFTHRVRYHEADAQGFLFNSRFLEIADVALTEFFRAHGWPYDALVSGGTDPSVVNAQITFTRPARFDDLLRVDVQCTEVGRSSFSLRTDFRNGDTTIATAELVYVNVHADSGTSRPLPAQIIDALKNALVAPQPASETS